MFRHPAGHAGKHVHKQEEFMEKWECMICGYIYDPTVGDPDNGIAPGSAWGSLPDDWTCPICGASKDDFKQV